MKLQYYMMMEVVTYISKPKAEAEMTSKTNCFTIHHVCSCHSGVSRSPDKFKGGLAACQCSNDWDR